MANVKHRRRDDSPPPDNQQTVGFDTNKKFYISLIAASVVISLIFSSIITMIMMPDSKTLLTQDTFNKGIERMGEIEELVQTQTALSTKLEQNYDALQTHLRHSSSRALKNILIDQEQNFQAFLTVFKAGMRDLALNIPDGMNWYNDYNEQMERAQQHSVQREGILNMLKVGAVTNPEPKPETDLTSN